MLKKAIANYINAKAEKIKPCNHEWELMEKSLVTSRYNENLKWHKWTYRCKKCNKLEVLENN